MMTHYQPESEELASMKLKIYVLAHTILHAKLFMFSYVSFVCVIRNELLHTPQLFVESMAFGAILCPRLSTLKVTEDDITFKLAIFYKWLPLNDNTGFFSIIQASKLVFWVFIGKK